MRVFQPELLTAPEQELYKADRRSRVWRVAGPGGGWVVKRFEYSPWRQGLALLVGLHPGQRERRQNRRLRRARVPVVPVMAWGAQRCGLGVRMWLASPWRGETLQSLLRDTGQAAQPRRRQHIARQLGRLLGRMFAGGWTFRDCKVSNMLLDEQERIWLIDIGSTRRGWGWRSRRRMLAVLNQNAREAGASRTDRLRALRVLLEQRPGLGGLETVARQVADERRRGWRGLPK